MRTRTATVKDKCRVCQKIIDMEVEISSVPGLGSFPTLKDWPVCKGGHKEEFEKVKDQYNSYCDFVYDKKKKVAR